MSTGTDIHTPRRPQGQSDGGQFASKSNTAPASSLSEDAGYVVRVHRESMYDPSQLDPTLVASKWFPSAEAGGIFAAEWKAAHADADVTAFGPEGRSMLVGDDGALVPLPASWGAADADADSESTVESTVESDVSRILDEFYSDAHGGDSPKLREFMSNDTNYTEVRALIARTIRSDREARQ